MAPRPCAALPYRGRHSRVCTQNEITSVPLSSGSPALRRSSRRGNQQLCVGGSAGSLVSSEHMLQPPPGLCRLNAMHISGGCVTPLCPGNTAVPKICAPVSADLPLAAAPFPAWYVYLTSPRHCFPALQSWALSGRTTLLLCSAVLRNCLVVQHRFSALQSWGPVWSYTPSRQAESSAALTVQQPSALAVQQPAAAAIPVLAALGQPAPSRIG